jgi:hypothetical protein
MFSDTLGISIIISLIPLFLTAVNIYNLFAKKQRISNTVDIMIFILGPLYMLVLYILWDPLSWQESTHAGWLGLPFHEPTTNYPTLLTLAAVAIAGYTVLRITRKPLPPLLSVLCMSAMYMGSILSILYIFQLTPHITVACSFLFFEGFLVCFFPLNFIISTIKLTRHITKNVAKINCSNKFLLGSNKLLAKSYAYPVVAFILMWPLLGILVLILMLFGQRPDSVITAFTNTSDWLFSQNISPPVEYATKAEYLCTAAAQGHERVVKPLRFGMRGEKRIIVNRQLCVANAFEEMLQEKTPNFRKLLRRVYDAVGCPIAKHINTPLKADIAYIVIKPLEWFLLIILYLVEVKPEDHIARQYLPITK